MKYSIALKNLPFEPEERQVIYVENQYDERTNAIIKGYYGWLKWTFKKSNLDFIYLPMFFNDEETKERILYYAPYLTTDIIESAELRSSFLLGYMSHVENREKITPSFIYAPKKECEEWIFQGQTFDLDRDDKNSIFHWFERIASEIEDELAIERPSQNIKFSIGPADDIRFHRHEESLDDSTQVEYSSVGPVFKSSKQDNVNEDGNDIIDDTEESTLDEIRNEDVRETVENLEKDIERLRLLGVPMAAIYELVAKYETVSRLRLTDDLRIFLPDYNNREVTMNALNKAVYFLFLNHPEGIVLQRLEDYHHELVNYYLQTSNREILTPRMINTINSLEYPGANSINIVLSRIKGDFKKTIDEHLAKHYYIAGIPGEPYRIALDNNLIEWEDEE